MTDGFFMDSISGRHHSHCVLYLSLISVHVSSLWYIDSVSKISQHSHVIFDESGKESGL